MKTRYLPIRSIGNDRKRGRRRGRPLLRLAAALAMALTSAASAALLMARPDSASFFEPGLKLKWQSPAELPDWARAVLDQHVDESDYQIRVALAELNRDRQPELLVAPAARRYDLFIPDSPLRVLSWEAGRWVMSESPAGCRPRHLGSFMTRGFWDLDCSQKGQRRVLRWTGRRYTG